MTLMVCAILCQDSTNCLAFNYKMNECALIDKYSIHENCTNMIYIREPCVYWDHNTIEDPSKQEKPMTLEDCILECRYNTNCNHVVLYPGNNICYIKDKTESLFEDNDVITAVQCLGVLKKFGNIIKLS
ncbi:unnamed protein product [Lepeophtheirus salmonis]|uniref:(salmon louse) hypothetical protein n=1 Tax=Lepeophtheirus salmonis TaxID=72036 RepID=A0A7R8H7H0_LEPSM|nr:unnamed protein product [Lepeophtheirus salmonis]CAF2909865.1 unnamed protein product [Lepeophtheirus salmonis]